MLCVDDAADEALAWCLCDADDVLWCLWWREDVVRFASSDICASAWRPDSAPEYGAYSELPESLFSRNTLPLVAAALREPEWCEW